MYFSSRLKSSATRSAKSCACPLGSSVQQRSRLLTIPWRPQQLARRQGAAGRARGGRASSRRTRKHRARSPRRVRRGRAAPCGVEGLVRRARRRSGARPSATTQGTRRSDPRAAEGPGCLGVPRGIAVRCASSRRAGTASGRRQSVEPRRPGSTGSRAAGRVPGRRSARRVRVALALADRRRQRCSRWG